MAEVSVADAIMGDVPGEDEVGRSDRCLRALCWRGTPCSSTLVAT